MNAKQKTIDTLVHKTALCCLLECCRQLCLSWRPLRYTSFGIGIRLHTNYRSA